MRKKIATTEIINKVNSALEGVQNNVPRSIKETYSFKGRKSPEVIEKVMRTLTDEGDYILDPFTGSGMSIISTQKAGRRFLGIELDNYTYSVNKSLFEKLNKSLLEGYFKEIENKIRDKVLYLYQTECCEEVNYIKKVLFDPQNGEEGYRNPSPNREIVSGHNIKLLYIKGLVTLITKNY